MNNIAFIATRGKEKIKVMIEDNFLLKGKAYYSSLEKREEFERLKQMYKERNYKIEMIIPTLKKEPEEKREIKQKRYPVKRIMGRRVKVEEEDE